MIRHLVGSQVIFFVVFNKLVQNQLWTHEQNRELVMIAIKFPVKLKDFMATVYETMGMKDGGNIKYMNPHLSPSFLVKSW